MALLHPKPFIFRTPRTGDTFSDRKQPIVTAIAIDDEPMALEVIRVHAAKVPFLELNAVFTDAFRALDYLQKTETDLLFLDIKMPDISGMDFVRSLSRPPMVIFTTAYSTHAVQSFELDAVDYLLKPFPLSRFLKACNKAHELYLLRNPSAAPAFVFVKSGYEQVRISLDEILYVESAGNYMNFILKDAKVMSRLSMQETLDLLPGDRFVRVHRSYIVAPDKVVKKDRQHVWIGERSIPIGTAYESNLRL